MVTQVKIDFVSDVMCPWCAIGLQGLLKAIDSFGDELDAEVKFHPFELAPHMPNEGELTIPHLSRKYGIPESQVKQTQKQITERGEALGFTFNFNDNSKKWNTFDCHQVLHWVGEQSSTLQLALKKSLLKAYFTDNQNPSDPDLLCKLVAELGLDPNRVTDILEQQSEAQTVRDAQQYWQNQGIQSVPTIIFNNRYAVTGGQPTEHFVATLEKIINEVR